MNRKVINALVQLFSLVSPSKESIEGSREIVERLLRRQLDALQTAHFLELFNSYLQTFHHINDADKKAKQKRTSLNSVKVLRICAEINEELNQQQKAFVLFRLIEFLYVDGELSEQDNEFCKTVAESFLIPADECQAAIQLVKPKGNRNNSLTRCIAFGNEQNDLFAIHLPSSKTFFVLYDGHSEMLLNAQPLKAGQVYVLPSAAIIRTPKGGTIYFHDIVNHFFDLKGKGNLHFTANQVSYRFSSGKQAIHKVSFEAGSGELIAIMGSSGAGKSTLLNLLNGILKPSEGSITINGIMVDDAQIFERGLIGYVSQDDLLLEELTVYENLWYNAKLCFGKASDEELKLRVERCLDDLNLTEIKDLKVGSPLNKTISGGQRKRLNISLELIREPEVLFVDEPTSGLSSRDSEQIIHLLKSLSLKGHLIFVVIHQPSSDIFKLFDRLILLDTGGYPVYDGNPVESITYFRDLIDHSKSNEQECPECGNVNPEQIFDILEARLLDENGYPTSLRKTSPREWNIFYKRSKKVVEPTQNSSLEEIPASGYSRPGWLRQFAAYFNRDLRSKLSNNQYLLINLLEAPILAFLMGFALRYSATDTYSFQTNQNFPAYLLICIIAMLFFGLTVSAEEIFRDKKILKREHFLHLSRGSYICSKLSVLFLLSAIQSFSFLTVGHLIMGIEHHLFHDWLILFSVACFANLLGLNISASFNSAVTIYILIPILIIPQLLLSGVLVRFSELNQSIRPQDDKVPIAANLMASRWAFEALAVAHYKDNPAEKPVFSIKQKISNSNYILNYWIPEIEKLLGNENNKAIIVQSIKSLSETETIEHLSLSSAMNLSEADIVTVQQWLMDLRKKQLRIEAKQRQKLDSVLLNMDDFLNIQRKHTNDYLTMIVRKSDQMNRIKLHDNTLIRNVDPIYQHPQTGHFLSGHLYSPYKTIGVYRIDTYWAGITAIWAMTIGLWATVYLNAFVKIAIKFRGFIRLLRRKISRK